MKCPFFYYSVSVLTIGILYLVCILTFYSYMYYKFFLKMLMASLVAQRVRNLPAMQETWVWSLGQTWQPTPVSLPGETCGQRSLAGYSPWGHKESDMTEWLTHTQTIFWVKLPDAGDDANSWLTLLPWVSKPWIMITWPHSIPIVLKQTFLYEKLVLEWSANSNL